MMVHSILYDARMFMLGLYIIKTFILKKDLSDKELFIIEHSYTWIRVGIVLLIIFEILYLIGSDLGLFDGRLYSAAVYSIFFIFYIVSIFILYKRCKYGSKDWKYVETTKLGIEGVIGLTILMILIYIFD